MAGSLEDWFRSLPPVTRAYLVAALCTTLAAAIGLVTPYALYLDLSRVWSHFEVWRLVTSFVYLGAPGFSLLILLMILVRYSARYETDPFRSGGTTETADVVFALLVMSGVLVLASLLLPLPFPGTSLVFGILYLCSRKTPTAPASVFGFKMEMIYLPWAFMALHVLLGSSPVPDLLAMAAGHTYYFLNEVVPHTHGTTLLRTPAWLSALFDAHMTTTAHMPSGGTGSFPRASGHSWGSGRVLGAQ